MTILRRFVTLLLCALAAPAMGGTIAGRVELLEKGGRRATDTSEVVVFVDGVRAAPTPAKVVISMKAKTFIPHVAVVGVGSSVEFPNDDPILHNVFSVSGENRFDLNLYKRPKSGSWMFHYPGIVRVYCNIHPQMNAIVMVRDNPYFARAAPDGSFAIEGMPAGKYTVKAWHERAAEVAQEVMVPASGEARAQLVLDASGFKRVPHKNKYGKDYSTDEKY